MLTACGIETRRRFGKLLISSQALQQCLPLAVLKRFNTTSLSLQGSCCNSAYRLRYWNLWRYYSIKILVLSCNSAYRLRYWNQIAFIRNVVPIFIVATVLTACGIETRRLLLVLYVFKLVATVLTACGIETSSWMSSTTKWRWVATVLTACGIETAERFTDCYKKGN